MMAGNFDAARLGNERRLQRPHLLPGNVHQHLGQQLLPAGAVSPAPHPPRFRPRSAGFFWQRRQARANRPGQFARQQPSPRILRPPMPGKRPECGFALRVSTAKRGVFGNTGRRVQTAPGQFARQQPSPAPYDLPRPGNSLNAALPSAYPPRSAGFLATQAGACKPPRPICASTAFPCALRPPTPGKRPECGFAFRVSHRETRGFWQRRQARANRPGQFARQQPFSRLL